MGGMKRVYEIKVKQKIIGNPILLVAANQEISLKSGKKVKAKELMAGDEITIGIPLLPGLEPMDVDLTVISLECTRYKSKSGQGIQWIKSDKR